jgi:hypothetical protein
MLSFSFTGTASMVQILVVGFAGIANVVIAYFVLRLRSQQARESWLRTYKDLHESFWSEPDFREVRTWLACNQSYAHVQYVFERRRLLDDTIDSVSEEEYPVLEKLDRFLNFLRRVTVIDPEFKERRCGLWKDLYFEYWLRQFDDPLRSDMRWYLIRFYESLNDLLKTSLREAPASSARRSE